LSDKDPVIGSQSFFAKRNAENVRPCQTLAFNSRQRDALQEVTLREKENHDYRQGHEQL
jgi:hypothetical protein